VVPGAVSQLNAAVKALPFQYCRSSIRWWI